MKTRILMRKSFGCLFILRLFLCLTPMAWAGARETSLSNEESSLLLGQWSGDVHLTEEFTGSCHHATYNMDFHLTMSIPKTFDEHHPGSVQGTAHVPDPKIENIPCTINPYTYSDSSTHYTPHDFKIGHTYITLNAGHPYVAVDGWTVSPAGHYEYQYCAHKGGKTRGSKGPYNGNDWPAFLPIMEVSTTTLKIYAETHQPNTMLLMNQPIGMRYAAWGTPIVTHEKLIGAHFVLQGSLQRINTLSRNPEHSSKWPIVFFLFLLLSLLRAITDPSATKFISAFGGVVGLGEALAGLGFARLAEQSRLGGFMGAALAEAVELARIYQKSTISQETIGVTAAKLAISFNVDLASFVISSAIMSAAIGVIATASGMIGIAGALVVGVGGAALLSYGLSQFADFFKEWLNEKF